MAQRKTLVALAARGFDSVLAQTLSARGETLSSLKSKTCDQLQELGVPHELIDAVLKEKRPPLPFKTAHRLLSESRWTCCICKDPTKSVVIHHIGERSSSKNDDEDNLAVLCLFHHGEAHTKRSLAHDLTAKHIREAKTAWLERVREDSSATAFQETSPLVFSTWDFFNHQRLLEVAKASSISLSALPEYHSALARHLINESGEPKWPSIGRKTDFMYSIFGSQQAYFFYKVLLERTFAANSWANLDIDWTVGGIRAAAIPGKLALCQGAFYIKRQNKKNRAGAGQMCKGLRRKGRIRLSFLFDSWEATSSSAYDGHLSGRTRLTGLFRVRELSSEAGKVHINCTCLALGTGFGPERIPRTPYEGLLLDEGGLDEEENEPLDFWRA